MYEEIEDFIKIFDRTRKERSDSQETAARKIDISKDHMNRILNRKKDPGLKTFYRMMQYVYGEEIFAWMEERLREYEKEIAD